MRVLREPQLSSQLVLHRSARVAQVTRAESPNDAMRERAKALGDLVAGEDGVARACALIEERIPRA